MAKGLGSVRRIGIIGDVHAEDELLARSLSFLSARGLDASLCVGDIVDGPGNVDRCVALLEEAKVYTVTGNHERWFLAEEMRTLPHATMRIGERSRAFLSSLPKTIDFDTPVGVLRLCHGIGEDDMAELHPDTRGYALQSIPTLKALMLDPDVRFSVGGHTHVHMVRSFPGLTVINAGTLAREQNPMVCTVDFVELRYAFHGVSLDGPITLLEEGALPVPSPLPPPEAS